MIIIPVQNIPSQQFDMLLEDFIWTFRIDYDPLQEYFYFGLDKDLITKFDGISLVPGINLVRQFNFMKGALIVLVADDLGLAPQLGDWGQNSDLYYLTDLEVQEIEELQNEMNING